MGDAHGGRILGSAHWDDTARVIPVEDKNTNCSTQSPRICFVIEFANYDRCGDIFATRSKDNAYVGNLF